MSEVNGWKSDESVFLKMYNVQMNDELVFDVSQLQTEQKTRRMLWYYQSVTPSAGTECSTSNRQSSLF